MRLEAHDYGQDVSSGLETTAPGPVIHEWLSRLGILTGGAEIAADGMTRIAALVPQLTGYPIACFTERSLTAAGKTFEFFPKMKPLCDFLDTERGRLREVARRCKAIASGDKPLNADGPREWRPPTPDELANFDRLMTEALAASEQALSDPNWIWHARMRELKKSGKWYDCVCPPPGKPGCMVPPDVLRQWGM